MAETAAAAVLHPPAARVSTLNSSASDPITCTMPSPPSAATSLEVATKAVNDQESPLLLPPTSSTPPLSFLALPADLHHLILAGYLPYDSIVALRSTSSYFHSLIPPSTLKRLRQIAIAKLLAEERTLLQKWLPQLYGRLNRRPATHMPCYSCLQTLPSTDFFAFQLSGFRGLGRKRAADRWCKPCGLRNGQIPHGRWMAEINYGSDDHIRYEEVMGKKLHVVNQCATCPPKDQFEGQDLWWGCVRCFEKEEKRLQKQDSERRRDVRLYCRRVKRGVKEFVEPDNLRYLGTEVQWWIRTQLEWHTVVRRGYSVYGWATDGALLERAGRTCGRIGRVLDPRQMQEPGQKLGKKARGAVGAVFDLVGRKKKEGGDERGAAEGVAPSTAAVEGCTVCCALVAAPTAPSKAAAVAAATASSCDHDHNHLCVPSPHREVRCWQCWRAKRSRRRRRYDDGLAYGNPLPMEQWCDGCKFEHERFKEMRKNARDKRRFGVKKEKGDDCKGERVDGAEDGEFADIGLAGLFEGG